MVLFIFAKIAAKAGAEAAIETRRADQAIQLERLGKLQAVLKANSFVEYLAE